MTRGWGDQKERRMISRKKEEENTVTPFSSCVNSFLCHFDKCRPMCCPGSIGV